MENTNNKVLALKYRPKNFDELIGQDIMVKTIINSIRLNKIPNAYLLTGIRGVGKTTTARIIAKAINCNKHFDHGDKTKSGKFCNCDEISNSKHLDVLEMDAASKTGIDDVRELIESSQYNPTSAKYKIIILDEVHMISKQAFNGLLKTLEEPPPHLKFIFATTEVKKIPVTIISRCQRFDLHRVPIQVLTNNLKKILILEKGKITDGAIKLIAKAAEGSVRDSLSLLDRALISQQVEEKELDESFIRKMLGIADRSKVLDLMKFIFEGNQKKSINQLRDLINEGIDPTSFLNDFMEMIYFILQKKRLGDVDSELSLPESEVAEINSISKKIDISTLIIFWQFIIKTLEELSIVVNPILSLEMLIIRLIHLKDIPSYEGILDQIKESDFNNRQEISIAQDNKKIQENNDEENEAGKVLKNQIKNIRQTKPELESTKPKTQLKENKGKKISSFDELIKLLLIEKEIELKYDLENNVSLIKFTEGNISISINEKIGKNFVRNLSSKLLELTEKRWIITLMKGDGQKTLSEIQSTKKNELLEREKKGEIYKKFRGVFPDGELVDVKKNKL